MRGLPALAAFLLVTTPALGSEVVDGLVPTDHNLILGVSRSKDWAEEMAARWRSLPRKKCGPARVVLLSRQEKGIGRLYWPVVDSHPVTNVECARTFYRRWLTDEAEKGYPPQTFHAISFRPPEKHAPYPDKEGDP